MSLSGCIAKINAAKEIFTPEEVTRLKLAALKFKRDGAESPEKMAVQAELNTLLAEQEEISDTIKNTPHFVQVRIANALEGKVSKPEAKVQKEYDADTDAQIKTKAERQTEAKEADKGNALFSVSNDPSVLSDPSPEEAQSVQDGIDGKSAIEATKFIAKNAPNKSHRLIAEKVAVRLKQLQDIGSIFTINVSHVGGEIPVTMLQAGVRGQVIQKPNDPETHIWVNGADVTGAIGVSYETVLHELVHAATQKAIDLGDHGAKGEIGEVVEDLHKVFSAITENIRARLAGGGELNPFEKEFDANRNNTLANIHELVSWALTNKKMQEYLDSIPYKKTTLWGEFVSSVRKFLGLQVDAETVLSEVLRVSDKLLSIDINQLKMHAIFQNVHMQVNYARSDSQGKGRAIVNGTTEATNPHTRSTLTAAIDQAFPKTKGFAGLLEATGKFHIIEAKDISGNVSEKTESSTGRILAYVKDGQTYLVADNISQTNDSVGSLLKHELGVHALRLGRTDAEFQGILKQVEQMRKMGNKQVVAAFNRVPADTNPDHVLEEIAAYLVEDSPSLSISQRIIAWIRKAIRRLGASIKGSDKLKFFQWANSLDETDIVAMATEATQNAPSTLNAANREGMFKAGSPGTFYSQLMKAMRDTPDRIFNTGKQVAMWLQANHGKLNVKKEELHWSGVLDWLNTQGKVSREDVLGYLQTGGVQVEEVILGDRVGKDATKEKDRLYKEALEQEASDTDNDFWYETLQDQARKEGVETSDLSQRERDELLDRAMPFDERVVEIKSAFGVDMKHRISDQVDEEAGYDDTKYTDTKFDSYVPPGGKPGSYRELLLTLPTKVAPKPEPLNELPDGYDVIQDSSQPKGRQWAVTLPGQAHARPMGDRHATPEAAKVEALSLVNNERLSTWAYDRDKNAGAFRSSHFDQPNIVAHLRVDEVEGANGERLLRVVEVQSDWGQQGRKNGYIKNIQSVENKIAAKYGDKLPKDADDWGTKTLLDAGVDSDLFSEWTDARKKSGRVPSAPFVTDTQAWISLAIKKAINYSAKNGMDGIVFATGQQSADLYDLSKSIDSVHYDPYNKKLSARKGNQQILNESNVQPEKIGDFIGKDAAKKLLETEPNGAGNHQLKGEGLRVEAAGMKAFYDKIIPQVADKVLKQIGADVKVQGMKLVTGEQSGFPITPTIRTKATREGFPMFSKQSKSLPGLDAAPPAAPPRQGGLGLEGGETGSRASWDSPEPSKIDDIIYKLQNKNIDLKRVIAAVKESGAAIADKYNAYLQEELFHGRAAKRTKDFVAKELKPMLLVMRMLGVTIPELEQYLHARHAKEANDLVAERNPDNPEMQDGGSGMKTKDAKDYLVDLSDTKRKRLEAAAAQVDAILAKTRNLYVSYGLVSKDQADSWAGMFQHYIPLMREDHDGAMGVGQGFSIKGKEVKHRTGSKSAVIDILANIALQRERVITRGEKNRVAVALAGLVKLNPNPDFWTFDRVPVERVLNEKTGLVEDRSDPMFRSRDNVIVSKIVDKQGDVHEMAVVFNERNERAVRMAQALKNLDASKLEGFLNASAKITRYFSAINTQYNPIFGIVNLIRDFQGSLINLSSTPIAGHQVEMTKHIVPALAGIYRATRGATKGKEPKSVWSDLWEEMQNEGGMTGYRDLYRDSEERSNEIKHALDPHSWHESKLGQIFTAGGMLKVPMSVAQDKAKALFDWLSDYNQTMEGAVRLSVYKTALDNGMNKAKAASLAKNISVNFNRKGQAGQQAGALYAFFNAAMQGTARIGETLTMIDKGNIKTLRLNSFGKKAVTGGIMLGSMQALLLLAAGFDEDEPPEFIRERNLILPIGDKKYITVPMPLGFHAIPNLGRIPTEFVMSGFKNPGDHVLRLAGVFAEAFNPMGSSGVSIQTIAPTAIDPLVALSENKDWTGRPIARKDFSIMSPTPGFTRNKDTASDPSKWLAEAINALSGGTKYTPGAMSPTADQIDYLFGQVTGGVGRESGKLEQSLMALGSGEELPPHKIPLVGRFYGDSGAQSSQGNKFYSNLKKINEVEAEIKGRKKDRLSVDEYKANNPAYRLIVRANMAESLVSKLRAKKRELMEKNAPRDQIKEVEARMTAIMSGLNQKAKELEAAH